MVWGWGWGDPEVTDGARALTSTDGGQTMTASSIQSIWGASGDLLAEGDTLRTLSGTAGTNKSTDGVNWERLPPLPMQEALAHAAIPGKLFVAGNYACDPSVFASTDDGQSWYIVHQLKTGPCWAYRNIAASGSTVAAVGWAPWGGVVSISRDGGSTFFDTTFPEQDMYYIQEVSVLPDESIVVGASRFMIQKSWADAWQDAIVPSGAQLSQLTFVSSVRGFAIAWFQNETPRIAVTNDGGESWQLTEGAPWNKELLQIFAAEDGTVYAVGTFGLYMGKP